MKKDREDVVEEFHKAFDIALGEEPTIELLKLRKALILEEVHEFVEEVDKAITILEEGKEVPKEVYADMLKELSDVQTIVCGTALSLKPLRKLQDAFVRVHESNMSKLGEDGKPVVRDDGKVLKGPHYKKPDLSDLV